MNGTRHVFTRTATAMQRFLHGDSGAGFLLILVAGAAMALANSPLSNEYHSFFHDPLGWTPIARLSSPHLWINDALMALFFFVAGLEIKREVLDGHLAHAAQRRLPVLAAGAGMALPALIFLATARSAPGLGAGWAIPAATDIAFAVGVLALVGKGLAPSLRLFLLTVAIVDDLGAVVIIAAAYTPAVDVPWLAAAGAALAAMALLGRARVDRAAPYAVLGALAWYCVLHSGVHATVAGVLAAFTIPLRPGKRSGDSLLLRLEHGLAPWNAYLVVPLFGLANAGVHLPPGGLRAALAPLPLAVAAGLVLGKQLGVFGAIVLAERTGIAARPHGATWLQLWGLSALCGIGFTMSLFIAGLAFAGAPELVEEAKLGILTGSAASGLIGFAILRLARQR